MTSKRTITIPDFIDMSQLGNIDPNYELGTRRLRTFSPISIGHQNPNSPQAVLRLYEIIKGRNPADNQLVGKAREFTRHQIESGKIPRELGLGFTIVSQGYLNIALWADDPKAPIVPKTNVYALGKPQEAPQKLSLEETGAFCAWELEIARAEAKAWRQYIKSKRTDVNKFEYLFGDRKISLR